MDWVFLRDGDASGSDSDGGVRVPGVSDDSASEDGSDSGFMIVRARKDPTAEAAAVSPVVSDDAPAAVVTAAPAAAVTQPTPPGFFKVVSYGEAFSASSSSATDGGALVGGGVDDGDTVKDRECGSEVGEHDGAGSSSVEAPLTSPVAGTPTVTMTCQLPCFSEATVLPCKALPEVTGGMEEEDAKSCGEEEEEEEDAEAAISSEEEDTENSAEEEEGINDENSGEEEEEGTSGISDSEEEGDEETSGDDESSDDEEEEFSDDESSGEEEQVNTGTTDSEEEEEDDDDEETSGDDESSDDDDEEEEFTDDESSGEDEQVSTETTDSEDDDDDDDDEEEETSGDDDSSSEEEEEEEEEEEFSDDENSGEEEQESTGTSDSDSEEEKDRDDECSSEDCFEIPATRNSTNYPGLEATAIAVDANDNEEPPTAAVSEPSRAATSGVETQRPEFVGGRRSYDDVDSDSDDMEESAGNGVASDVNASYAFSTAPTASRALSEFFYDGTARTLPRVYLSHRSEFVSRGYDYIDGDIEDDTASSEAGESCCEEEDDIDDNDDDTASSESEESCCEEEDDIYSSSEEEEESDDDIDSGDEEESDNEVVYDFRWLYEESDNEVVYDFRWLYDDDNSLTEPGFTSSVISQDPPESCGGRSRSYEDDDIYSFEEEEEESDDDTDSSDEEVSDNEVVYDFRWLYDDDNSATKPGVTTSVIGQDPPEFCGGHRRSYDDIDTSDYETDESDHYSTTSSEEEESNDAVHDIRSLCGHIGERKTSKRPVELCLGDCDVRPAQVICKNGKAIYIIYNGDGDMEYVDDPKPEATASGGGAQEHVEPVRQDFDKPEIEDLLLEMADEFIESARTKQGDVDRRDTFKFDSDGEMDMAEASDVPAASRGPAGSFAPTFTVREMEKASVAEELRRQAAAQEELDRALARRAAASAEALESALQGWRDATRQATAEAMARRAVAESDAAPGARAGASRAMQCRL